MAAAAPHAGPTAPAAVGRTRVRPRQLAVDRHTAAARPRLGRGVAWIAIVAALLAGIVALSVVVLQLRMERGKLQSEIVTIRSENSDIESQISGASSVSRVESAARRLGLVEPASTSYVEAGQGK